MPSLSDVPVGMALRPPLSEEVCEKLCHCSGRVRPERSLNMLPLQQLQDNSEVLLAGHHPL